MQVCRQSEVAARWSIFQLKAKLWRLYCDAECLKVKGCVCGAARRRGIYLQVETPEENASEHRGRMPARIYVDTPAIADLVEQYSLRARAYLGELEAKREGGELDPALEDAGELDAHQVVSDYRDKRRSFLFLARKYRAGRPLLRRVLVAARQPIRHVGGPKIEERRKPETIAKALRLRDDGASVSEVARILGCSRRGAARFLVRHGRLGAPLPPTPSAHPEEREGDRLRPGLDGGAGGLGSGPRGPAGADRGRGLAARLLAWCGLRRRGSLGRAPAA